MVKDRVRAVEDSSHSPLKGQEGLKPEQAWYTFGSVCNMLDRNI